MATNSDGSVTLRTRGKVAVTPSGSGTGKVNLATAKPSIRTSTVTKQKGRGPVSSKAGTR